MRLTLDNLSEVPANARGQLRLVYIGPRSCHNRLGINGYAFFWKHEIVHSWEGTWKVSQSRKDQHDTLP